MRQLGLTRDVANFFVRHVEMQVAVAHLSVPRLRFDAPDINTPVDSINKKNTLPHKIFALMYRDMKTSPRTVATLIGYQRLADAVGVSRETMRNTVCKPQLPASWARQVRRLLAEDGRDPMAEAPDDLFTFK